ncbi:GyrI-like domain-containing protein [bacterium]|nr:GyrI-like domain-containing protein [bacterium]
MIDTINAVATIWWQWMSAMFWQVILLIGIVSLIDLAIRKWAWPQVRYGLWLLVLLKLVLPPTWSSPVSLISHAQPALRGTLQSVRPAAVQRIEAEPDGSPGTAGNDTERAADTPVYRAQNIPVDRDLVWSGSLNGSEKPVWQVFACIIWLAGMILFSVILLLKLALLRRWHDQQDKKAIPVWFHQMLVETAALFQLNHLPAIVFHKQAKTPAVYGLLRPVMLLPAGYFDHLSEKEARHVLLHELAHLKRGDLWLHGICLFLQIVYWFNPLLIWVRRQMKHVREICCDLTVAGVLREKTPEYRQTLLNTAREMLTENMQPGLGLLGVFEDPFRLVTRLKWLERNTWNRRKRMLISAAVISLALSAAVVPMAERPAAGFVTSEENIGPSSSAISENLNNAAGDSLMLELRMKQVDAFYAVVLPMSGDPDTQLESSVASLKALMKKQKIKAKGPVFGRYFSDPDQVELSQRMWEVGVPVKPKTKVKPPLEKISVNTMHMVTASVTGIKNTEPVWDRFIQKMQNRGYVPCFPPAYEVWTSRSKDEPFWWHTELRMQAIHPPRITPGQNIVYKETEPQTVVILPVQGSYYQHPRVIEQIKAYLKDNHIEPRGAMFGRYFTPESETHRNDLYWEVGVPVEDGVSVDPPYKLRRTGGRHVASVIYEGPCSMEHPWSPFIVQSLLNGWFPANPGVEIWHEDTDPSYTELQIGAEKLEGYVQNIADWVETLTGENGTEISRGSNGSDRQSILSMPGQVSFKQVSPFQALILPMKGSYDQHVTAIVRLAGYLEHANLQAAGPLFGRYYSNPNTESAFLEWEVGIPVSGYADVEEPFVLKQLETETVAWSIAEGKHEGNRDSAWALLTDSLQKAGYNITGPAMEIWLGEPGGSGESVERTELRLPVQKSNTAVKTLNNLREWFKGWNFDTGPKSRFTPERMAEQWLLIRPATGSFEKASFVFETLQDFMRSTGINTLSAPIIRQYNNEPIVPVHELRWDAAYVIRDSIGVKPPFVVKHMPERMVLRFEIKPGTNQERWSRQTAAWLFYNNYRNVPPSVIYWKQGLLQPGEAMPPVEVQIEIMKVDPPYDEVVLNKEWIEGGQMLVLPMTGSRDREIETIERLDSWIKKQGILVKGDPFIQYFDNPEVVGDENVRWHAGYRLKFMPNDKLEAPFDIKQFKEGNRISTEIVSDQMRIPERDWLAFTLTFIMNGYIPHDYPMKVVHDYSKKPYRFELQWPVTESR